MSPLLAPVNEECDCSGDPHPGGTYAGFQITTSGTADRPIVFKAEPLGAVLLNDKSTDTPSSAGIINMEGSSYIVIDGSNIKQKTVASLWASEMETSI